MRVQGSGFRGWGSEFGVQGLGCEVWGFGFRVQGLGFGVWGWGFVVEGSGLRVEGSTSPPPLTTPSVWSSNENVANLVSELGLGV